MTGIPKGKTATVAVALAVASASAAFASSGGFVDATETNLPAMDPGGRSMHAAAADIDDDGDLDIIVAREFQTNLVLVNDGAGRFTDGSAERLPVAERDSEEVIAADFNGDGHLDLFFASEDDQVHELYFNDGSGRFSDESRRVPLTSVANGALAIDVNVDGYLDIILANNGANAVLVNDGAGNFRDEAAARLPATVEVSQDVEAGDVDGDGDVDLVFANEGPNAVLLNDGTGVFTDGGGLPPGRLTESRMASLGDVDGDGDLDLFFANVQLFVAGADPQNQLYINDGAGNFTEETDTRLPPDADASFEGKLADLDADGDLDVIVGNTNALLRPGDAPVRVYLNEDGRFVESTDWLPASARGNVFSIAADDFTGDGRLDVFLALRYGQDRLLIGR
jgi:hypothetical protein